MPTIVEEHLNRRSIPFSRVHHRPVRSALEEAETLRWGAEDVVKGVLLDSKGRRILAVVPASRRLNMSRVRRVLGDPHARITPIEDIAREYPGLELGPLPPVASLLEADIEVVDLEVFSHDEVYLAGAPDTSIEMQLADLLSERPFTIASITQAPRQLPKG